MSEQSKVPAFERTTLRVPRALTAAERELTQWIILHGDSDRKEFFLSQSNEAEVIRHCPCGCDSVDFRIPSMGKSQVIGLTFLGDFVFGSATDGMNGIFVFAQGNILAGLEVYSMDGLTTPKLPKISDLRMIE